MAIFKRKSKGNIESIITILPQVAIFLISFQLVFMQFMQSKDAYLLNKDRSEIQESPLIGGGKMVISSELREQPTFLANLIKVKAKTMSIAIDENSIN
jgi:hypothetical protein